MENITVEFQGSRLVMIVDLEQEVGLSASGKSTIIATTGGNISLPGYDEIKLGVNVYRPVPAGRAGRRRR